MFPQTHDHDSIEKMLHLLSSSSSSSPMPLLPPMDHRSSSSSRWKPSIEVAPNCPRCASTNTKFCYYNNYSLSQPRYFCKGCRRYWTKGGSLRNVPVGGGCRRNRRGKSSRNNQSQTERLSINTPDGGGNNSGSENGSRDIDMALVFAKFLNQNPNSTTTVDDVSLSSSNNNNNFSTASLTPESVETENDSVVQPDEKNSDADALFEGLLGMGVNVDDDVVQDVLWSDHDDAMMNIMTSSSNNTWELQPPPMMQLQLQEELEYYSMPLNYDGDGHNQLLPITTSTPSSTVNLISDSWSSWSNSFDLSTDY